MKPYETLLCHDDESKYEGAVVPPVFQNSLFTFPDWDSIDKAFQAKQEHFIYSRGKNPTVEAAEKKLAEISGAERAMLFTSGMAAISAAILAVVKHSDHIITVNSVYGPTANFISVYLKEKFHIDSTFVDGENVEDFAQALRPNTRLIYLETPSSVVLKLQDIQAVTELAKKHGIAVICDNTWATPLFQKTLSIGVDFEVHSVTKYLGGHSDVIAGVVLGKENLMKRLFEREYEWIGGKIAPFEAWLILRSLRTLTLRMAQHQSNALKVARYLEQHPKVSKVNYPALESFKQFELAKKQMIGFSGLFSFEMKTKDVEEIKKFYNALQLIHRGVSWGGFESLAYIPAISYLKELKPEQFEMMGISLGNVRLSVGLEGVDDIIADLERALG